MEKELIAIGYILFEAHQYKPGDVLPASNHEMVEAWIESKTAEWREKQDETGGMRARPSTAEAGMTGAAIPSSGEDELIGKVPSRGRKARE